MFEELRQLKTVLEAKRPDVAAAAYGHGFPVSKAADIICDGLAIERRRYEAVSSFVRRVSEALS